MPIQGASDRVNDRSGAFAFAIGHASGSIFKAVECGLMGVVADVGDVLSMPI